MSTVQGYYKRLAPSKDKDKKIRHVLVHSDHLPFDDNTDAKAWVMRRLATLSKNKTKRKDQQLASSIRSTMHHYNEYWPNCLAASVLLADNPAQHGPHFKSHLCNESPIYSLLPGSTPLPKGPQTASFQCDTKSRMPHPQPNKKVTVCHPRSAPIIDINKIIKHTTNTHNNKTDTKKKKKKQPETKETKEKKSQEKDKEKIADEAYNIGYEDGYEDAVVDTNVHETIKQLQAAEPPSPPDTTKTPKTNKTQATKTVVVPIPVPIPVVATLSTKKDKPQEEPSPKTPQDTQPTTEPGFETGFEDGLKQIKKELEDNPDKKREEILSRKEEQPGYSKGLRAASEKLLDERDERKQQDDDEQRSIIRQALRKNKSKTTKKKKSKNKTSPSKVMESSNVSKGLVDIVGVIRASPIKKKKKRFALPKRRSTRR